MGHQINYGAFLEKIRLREATKCAAKFQVAYFISVCVCNTLLAFDVSGLSVNCRIHDLGRKIQLPD